MDVKNINILIIEDDAVIAGGLSLSLTKLGFNKALVAYDDESALEVFRKNVPKLIFMDFNLGSKKDGAELAAIMKEEVPSVSIIFTTAVVEEENIKRAIATDPDGYLIKPYSEDDLRAVVHLAVMKLSKENKEGLLEEGITDFSKKIKLKRKELGLTQEEASERLEMNYRHYQNIETGKVDPKLTTLKKLIKFFKI